MKKKYGDVTLTKNTDPDKYCYSGFGVGFYEYGKILLLDDRTFDKKAIIFGVDDSSSVHADIRKKDILILHKGPTDELDYTIIIVEAECSINFSKEESKFCLSLYYNGISKFCIHYVRVVFQKNLQSITRKN